MLVINRQWPRKVIETKAILFAIEHYFFVVSTNREISILKWAVAETNRVSWNFLKDAMFSSQVDQVIYTTEPPLESLKKINLIYLILLQASWAKC